VNRCGVIWEHMYYLPKRAEARLSRKGSKGSRSKQRVNESRRMSARALLFASAFAFLFKAGWGVRMDKMSRLRRSDSLSVMSCSADTGLSGLSPCRAMDRPNDVRV
jgi:hypothetical protein